MIAWRRTILLAGLICWGVGAGAAEADRKLGEFFREYLEASFRLQPVNASQLGEHRYDHLLEDLTPEARAKWLALDRQTLEKLPEVAPNDQLSPAGKIDRYILEKELRRSIWLTENFHPFEDDPRTYGGYISDSVYQLLAQSSLPLEVNVSNAIARIRQVPKVVSAARANLQNPPLVKLETAIRQNEGAINFYRKDLFELTSGTRQSSELKRAAEQLVPVLVDYQRFLTNDLMPRAKGDWRIGPEKFARKLELTLDAGMTAQQVLDDALAEFDRVQREMYVVARQLWSRYFPRQTLPPDDAEGRRETVQKVVAAVSKEHAAPDELLADVQRTVGAIKEFIRQNDILRLPEPDTCEVVEMPEFRRGNSTAYMQSPPPLDPDTRAFFAVSPPPSSWDAARVASYLEEYNRHMNQILTIHEAYPGHYVQLVYANRNPSLVRKVLQSGVYIEGWAVYTEQMLLDQGYGEGDLRLRLNQLKFYLRAVANAILDHRMHCTEMTDEQALDLLMRQAYQSEGEARLKVIRAKQSSVQLSTYFVGRMAMYRLRQTTQRMLGPAFSLGRYHEAVLEPGAVPVSLLPRLVQERLGL